MNKFIVYSLQFTVTTNVVRGFSVNCQLSTVN